MLEGKVELLKGFDRIRHFWWKIYLNILCNIKMFFSKWGRSLLHSPLNWHEFKSNLQLTRGFYYPLLKYLFKVNNKDSRTTSMEWHSKIFNNTVERQSNTLEVGNSYVDFLHDNSLLAKLSESAIKALERSPWSLKVHSQDSFILGGIYLFKDNNRNTKTMCEICLRLTIKTTEWRQWLVKMFLLLASNK